VSIALSAAEKSYLRSDNQHCKLYLAVYSPSEVFTARVDGNPASNDNLASVSYDGGSAGWGDTIVDQTVYVGSSPGAYDKGMARLRGTLSGTSGTMDLGEMSEIDWDDNDYLTVVDEFALWARHIRIDSSGNIYMDYDVAYSDQHENCDPLPVMGPDAVVWLENGSATVSWGDASTSEVPGSSPSSYSWSSSHGSFDDSTSATPTLTVTSAGVHRVSCTVTASNGSDYTGYRRVFVFDKGSTDPTDSFVLENCNGDWNTGGWSYEVMMYDEAQRTEIRERTLVILFARDYYGNTETSIGPIDDRENIVAAGWVAGESIEQDPEAGTVRFTVQGPQWWMNNISGFPSGLQDVQVTPEDWTEFEDLTVDDGLWHFLRWRTTVARRIDIQLTGDTRGIAAWNADTQGTLWEQMRTESQRTILAQPCCDKYGRLFVEIDSNLLPTGDRASIPTIQEIEKEDWSSLVFERKPYSRQSLTDISGVAYSGGSGSALFALAPGHVFRWHGKPITKERLALSNQSQANTLAALIAAKANNQYPNIDIDIAENHRAVDICPHQYFTISTTSSDNERGITLTNEKIIPRRISFTHDPEAGALQTSVTCEAETTPGNSQTGDPPASPPDPPAPELPEIPGTSAPIPNAWDGPVKAMIAWDRAHLGYCPDILLRLNETYSSATTGTSGTDLYDTSVNFNDMNVIIGDYVYNITDKDTTTIASVVSGSQLQLVDDISLDPGDEYAVIGAEWHDVTPAALASGLILDVKVIRTGDNSVAAWVLGDDGTEDVIYHTSNILTTSPSWSAVLTETEIASGIEESFYYVAGIAVDSSRPDFAIVTFKSAKSADNTDGAMYTTDAGSNWDYSTFPGGAMDDYVEYRAVAADGGTVWVNAAGYCFISADGGVNFIETENIPDSAAYKENVSPLTYVKGHLYYVQSPPGVDGTRIFRGGSDGTGWTRIDDPNDTEEGVKKFGIAGHEDGFILGGPDDTLTFAKSESRGDDGTWSQIMTNPPSHYGNGETGHAHIWKPDSDVILSAGKSEHASRPLFYSPDGGGHWIDITTNWEGDLGNWGGAYNTWSVGIIPLPRVGDNE